MVKRRSSLSIRKSRLRYLLLHMIAKYNVVCCLCDTPITEIDIPIRSVDLLTEHHLDGNHSNWQLANLTLVHRECHKQYHTKDNILLEKGV